MGFKNHLTWKVHTVNDNLEFEEKTMTVADSFVDYYKSSLNKDFQYHDDEPLSMKNLNRNIKTLYFSKRMKIGFSYCPHGNFMGCLVVNEWSLAMCPNCFYVLRTDHRTAQLIYNATIWNRIDRIIRYLDCDKDPRRQWFGDDKDPNSELSKLNKRQIRYDNDPILKYEMLYYEYQLLNQLLLLC